MRAALLFVLAATASCDTAFGIHSHADAAPAVGDGEPADAAADGPRNLSTCEAQLYGSEQAFLSGVTSWGLANDEHLAIAIQTGNVLYSDNLGASFHQLTFSGGPYVAVGLSSDGTDLLLGAGLQRALYDTKLESRPASWSQPTIVGTSGTPGASTAHGDRYIIESSGVFVENVAGMSGDENATYTAADLGHPQALINSPGLFDGGLSLVYLVTGPLETGVWLQKRSSTAERFGATGSMLFNGSYRSVTASLGCRTLWLIDSNDRLTRVLAQ